MVSTKTILVRTVEEKDRQQLANLIHFETYVHRHLDWRAPLDWIGHEPYLVAERKGELLGVLICPPDPDDVYWIRLFAVSSNWRVQEAWSSLWQVAWERLARNPGVTVAALPLQAWFQNVLEGSGYTHTDNVVSLVWQRGTHLPEPRECPVRIRPMNYDDLEAVSEVDAAAFSPMWRNSLESLQLAYKQHAVATVAEDDERIWGYQISTASPMGGHLARLAVHPESQGKGIGYSVVRDVLDQFERRGALRVTVNTQEENRVSLSLYQKVGFTPTGEVYPVYNIEPKTGGLPGHPG